MGKRVLICILLSTVLLFSVCSLSFGAYRDMREQKSPSGWTGTGASYGVSAYTLPEGGTECIIVQDKLFFRIFRPPFNYSVSDGEKTLYETAGMYWGMTSSEDAIIVLENRPKNGTDIFYITVIPIDEQNIRTVQVEEVPAEYGRIKQVFSYGKELLVLYENNAIGILRGDGAIEKWLNLPEEYISFKTCYPYLIGSKAEKNDLYTLDCSDYTVNYSFSTGKGLVFPDQEEGKLLLAMDEGIDKIYPSGHETFIVWDECSIAESRIHCINPMGNGNYLIHDEEGFKLLHPIDPGEQKQKIRLNIATLHTDTAVQRFIAGFNANNEQYYVKIIDYSDNGNYDADTAQLRLNTEIISGKSPDMICVSSVSPFPFMRKGLLENLVNYLDADDEIGIEDISIANALQRNGGIYFIGSDFSIETLEGLYSRFGDRNGWTLEEYLEMEQTLPSDVMTIYNMTFDTLLDRMIPQYVQHAVDWNTATCNFDNPTFISLLNLGKQMRETPEDPDDLMFGSGAGLVSAGKLITAATMATQVWSFAQQEKEAGNRLSFIGWPTVDGKCGSEVYLFSPVSMLSTSKYQEGCWQFIKYMLMHTTEGLPVYLPALIEEIKAAQNNKDLPVEFIEEDAEELLSIIFRQENIRIYDEVLKRMIQKECNAFFYGTRTAEETAKILQSKVSLYLAEQKQ